jgi:acyl dehydratase
MRALLCKKYGPIDSLEFDEIEAVVLGPGQVSIRVHACGVNFPDTITIKGLDQYKPQLPFSPGGEYAGTIEAIGEGVTGFSIGDRVLSGSVWGGFREVAVTSAHNTFRIPDSMDYTTASVFICAYGTAIHTKQRLGKKLIQSAQSINRNQQFDLQRFEQNELILHSLVRPVGLSTSVAYSNLFKNTHPLHINNARYATKELAVSGGFIMPIILGAAQRDFKESIHERILETKHINPVNHEESLGAFSYILDSKRAGGIEELTIRTFGVKNTDVERELAGMKIPMSLLRTDKIKPSELETICRQECPELASLICMRIDWKLWRKIGG